MTLFEKIKLFPYYLNGFLMGDPDRNGEYLFLKKYVKDKKNFILFDVGANIGEYTNKALKYNENLTSYAFEPVKMTFNELVKNVPKELVFCENEALSNKIGKNFINVYGNLYGINSIESHKNSSIETVVKEEININTLDNFVEKNKIKVIDLMKIDTEGHDLNVLIGSNLSIEKGVIKAIQFEYNYIWKSTSNTLKETFAFLEPNFDIYRLTPFGKLKISKFSQHLENYPKASNYIAISKN